MVASLYSNLNFFESFSRVVCFDDQSQSVMCHAVTAVFQAMNSGRRKDSLLVQTDSDAETSEISTYSSVSLCCGPFMPNTFRMSLGGVAAAI